jgi:ribose 5-phosphate isomerase B
MKNDSTIKKVIVAGDHYAVDLSEKVVHFLEEKGLKVINIGAIDSTQTMPLTTMIPALVDHLDDQTMGVLICGTGVGVEVGANRFKGVRASLCTSVKTASDARQYDKANVLCLSAWQTANPDEILDVWLNTSYDGNEQRLEMFAAFDEWAK